jgi:hypothetical protein
MEIFSAALTTNKGIQELNISHMTGLTEEGSLITFAAAIGNHMKITSVDLSGITFKKKYVK